MIYLNGEFMPLEQAKIPVLDRGFIFGDGVYELIPVYSRRPFRLGEHLERLRASLDATAIVNPHSDAQWSELFRRVIAENPWEDQSLYLQVTRGVAPRDHRFPVNATPTVFIMSSELTGPPAVVRERGAAAITREDFRWLRCDIKSISLLGNCLLRQAAADADCIETILHRDGYITEASSSNVFVVSDGLIVTPPKSNLMLPGITYDVVLEILKANEIRHEVRTVPAAELRPADEIWLTSSTKEVLAVTMLDGKPVGAGRPGTVYARVYSLYQDFKANVMRAPGHD
ncbi:MAG: D-amino acid aminotransferase [Betaproteobacteria bacterium]|nr:D-amino acid aminotransferase [Betaproteobacteria bacterium]